MKMDEARGGGGLLSAHECSQESRPRPPPRPEASAASGAPAPSDAPAFSDALGPPTPMLILVLAALSALVAHMALSSAFTLSFTLCDAPSPLLALEDELETALAAALEAAEAALRWLLIG